MISIRMSAPLRSWKPLLGCLLSMVHPKITCQTALRYLIFLLAGIGTGALPSYAEGPSFLIETIMSSAVLDRGEQIGNGAVELAAVIELPTDNTLFYGAVYRRVLLDDDEHGFEDEADYTLGVVWEGEGYTMDVSANWLTYPGHSSEHSLELGASVVLDAFLSPGATGFFDVHTEDWGVEISAGPEWSEGRWSYYAIGRGGVVVPGDGSAQRSYVGLEFVTGYAVTHRAEVAAFLRVETSNKHSFFDYIDNTGSVRSSQSGIATGVALSIVL